MIHAHPVKQAQDNPIAKLFPDIARAYQAQLYKYVDPQRALQLMNKIPENVRPLALQLTKPVDLLVQAYRLKGGDPKQYYESFVQKMLHQRALQMSGMKDARPDLASQMIWSPLGTYSPYLRYAPWLGGAMTLLALLGAATGSKESRSKWPLLLGLLGLGTMAAPLLNRWYATYRDRGLWLKVLEAARKNQGQQQQPQQQPQPQPQEQPQGNQGQGEGS